jgi:hypothetical protein
MVDFTLIHVPTTKFRGSNALSRILLVEGEKTVPDDDECLDNIALGTGVSQAS